jgi:hypothetical protein
MPTKDTSKTWLIGILTTLVVALVVAGWSDLGVRITRAAQVIEAHAVLPGHPASLARIDMIQEQLRELRQELGDVHRDVQTLIKEQALQAKGVSK